ncbi:MAG: class I SAM-dependent methyltransferase [Gammaproteobacteria bacterium]|nr:class I SAM-dependent methyltransferase [Gammaproteobacteria bacterium]NNF60152.1 class I SAM-dependent methyltransferase [Gammaproteobacteria bacterium]NNM21564.1 class I SAM-dependent methyltransferase [Gammaproteobacteria bacterium]
MGYRAKIALAYSLGPLASAFKWLWTSRETTNFTYDLEEKNKRYLASLLAELLDVDYSEALGYIRELEDDAFLTRHLRSATAASDFAFMADDQVHYGRRLGWYVITRVIKPRTIVETGVDKGLGACVLAAALMKNREEGHEGRYYGTDINPKAGYLLSGRYAEYGEVLYGDSIQSLTAFDKKIDLFINDSDHSADYEAREYQIIAGKLSEQAIVLGDNSHLTDKLLEFSLQSNRRFVYFQEQPENHWYRGAGIGISFKA